MKLSSLQKEFCLSILNRERKPSPEISQIFSHYSSQELIARLSIYRNNTYLSLIEVLSDTFYNVVKTVGSDFFTLLAKDFIQASPPASGNLIYYGETFSHFIASHSKTKTLPYLSDLARLDFARHNAYYTSDEKNLTPHEFSTITPGNLANSIIIPHPSVTLIHSKYAIYSIHEFNEDLKQSNSEIHYHNPEYGLTLKTANGIITHQITQQLYNFLEAIHNQFGIGEALEQALNANPTFNASEAIQFLVQSSFGIKIIESS